MFLALLSCLPILSAFDCHCSGCEAKYCTGDYCYAMKSAQDSDPRTGCITPRDDIWKNEILPMCERNHVDTTFCLCNQDLCNGNTTFVSMLSTGPFAEQKLINCTKIIPFFEYDPPQCQSTLCTYKENRDYIEFVDFVDPPFTYVYRDCPNTEDLYAFRTDIRPPTPQMNSCLQIRYPDFTKITCVCNTTNCNDHIPIYDVPLLGKGICYLKSKETEKTTCWGDYCYWEWQGFRGCIDAAGADQNFELRLGESTLDNNYFTICKGDYCNSDILFPNGTIVGPSATRRFVSSEKLLLSLIPSISLLFVLM